MQVLEKLRPAMSVLLEARALTQDQKASPKVGVKSRFIWASQVVLVVKNLPANARYVRCGFSPWVEKIP